MADRRKLGAPPDSTFHRVLQMYVLFGVFGGFLGTQLTTLLTAVVYGAPGHQQARSTGTADGQSHITHCFDRISAS